MKRTLKLSDVCGKAWNGRGAGLDYELMVPWAKGYEFFYFSDPAKLAARLRETIPNEGTYAIVIGKNHVLFNSDEDNTKTYAVVTVPYEQHPAWKIFINRAVADAIVPHFDSVAIYETERDPEAIQPVIIIAKPPHIPISTSEYARAALRTANLNSGGSPQDRKMNWVLGIAGESGEIAELVKKARFHGVDFESATMAKELGDLLWYITVMANEFGYSLDTIMRMNMEKLAKRYPDGFVEGGGNRE